MLSLALFHLTFPKAGPVAISYNTWDHRDSFLILLCSENQIGMGSANPFKPVTGDSAEELVQQAKGLPALDLDPHKDSPEELYDYLHEQIASMTLKAALDCAYHDLVGQVQQKPVYQLYSPIPHYVDNSITIFLKETIQETAAEAEKIFSTYPDLKILKIKLKGEQDIERATAIKSVAPEDIEFTLDANQAFSDPKEAVTVLNQIAQILENVILVEEPCPKGQLPKLRYVTDNVDSMLVFADESAATFEDAKAIIHNHSAHGVNIKLQKAGGIWQARKISEHCQANGLKVMVGAMLEDTLALTAAAHFAASTDGIVLTDLDTDLDLPNYIGGGSHIDQGLRQVLEKPGLGAIFNKARMDNLAQQGLLTIEKLI